jgi:putative FmdB family regulatory protein
MPTYEYACSKCEHQFEKVQSITEKALTVCPKELCPREPWGKGRVKRRISAGGGLIFKGSGFYITDYRSENYKAGAKKETESAKPAKPAEAAKTEKTTGGGGGSGSAGQSASGTASSPTPSSAKESK